MELLQLKYFCHAAESENFSATAKIFSVPASNISQTVKRLENELGTPLFTRNSNRITLNQQGKEFYEKIKKALFLIENAKSNINPKSSATMKIGIFSNRRLVMNAVEKFQKQYPNIDLVISHDKHNTNTDFDIIISDKLDFASSLEQYKFFSERLLLAANKDYFKNPNNITIDKIREKPFISMSNGTGLYDINQKICLSLGFKPRIALQSDDPFYIRKCIELGLGICFVPEFSWQGQYSDKIKFMNFGDYTRDVYIYRRKKNYEPWFVKEFYTALINEYNNETKNQNVF